MQNYSDEFIIYNWQAAGGIKTGYFCFSILLS